jgi:sn-1 stearoyl-lipid 9-desaturase
MEVVEQARVSTRSGSVTKPQATRESACLEIRNAAFLGRVLEPPKYGYANADGTLYKPSRKEIFSLFAERLNVFADKRNWLAFTAWFAAFTLAGFFIRFVTSHYFSWPLFFLGLVYAMVCLGTHGTIFLHRYSTHHAYNFKNEFWKGVCRNLSIKIIPEEIYVISHHVHHSISDKPGDPYNPEAGWLYCFLADANHQPVARDLTETEYTRMAALMKHTGVKVNTYEQYKRWGSLCHPLRTVTHYILNWAAWYGIFFLIGGHALALAIFAMSAIWAFGVRTFNFDGHGGGRDKRTDGVDFHRKDLAINQIWPGYVAGEWHNNHHLYPNGARSGFLPHQLDLAWIFIRSWNRLGLVSNYRDYKEDFLEKHYRPYHQQLEKSLQLQRLEVAAALPVLNAGKATPLATQPPN